MLLMLALACLHTPAATAFDVQPLLPSPALGRVFASQDPDAVFDEAVDRRMDGDVHGAIERLAWLRAQGDRRPGVLYQLGVAYEFAGDHRTALQAYETLISEDLSGEYHDDAGFRRGICLEELGRWEEALDQYRAIPTRDLSGSDLWTMQLAQGIAEVRNGRQRQGGRRIAKALVDSQDSEITWMRAKALFTLQDMRLLERDQSPLEGSSKRQAKHLRDRAAQIADAEAMLVQIVYLGEPEWILRGLLALGDAYSALHQEFVTAPPPAHFDAEQRALYQSNLDEHGQVLRRKAWEAYDQGLVVAGTYGVESPVVRELAERQAALGL
ncbi:MAG: tetratricopeptide (TPR) repeat protein [Cognaticolwellia sp.]|jgi:tetratricopeptide (TPR) repeat protein